MRLLETTTTRTRLLTLLGVDGAATLVAVAATGAFRFDVFGALVALVAAASAVASFPFVRGWLLEDEAPVKESSRSLNRTKKILILAMCAGAIAFVGGRGTFAVFTAETTNANNGVTSGTLVLGNTNNTNSTTCYSYSGTVVYNAYGNCQPLWSAAASGNMAPGLLAQSKLTVENTGSIDASTFYLSSTWPRTTLAAQANPGSPSTIVITASSGFNPTVAAGNTLQLSYGSFVEQLTVAGVGATSGGNTTINISAGTLVHTYPAGARVENISANTSAANTDCFDATTTAATVPVTNATPGSSLPFVSTTNNPLCNTLVFWVQEQKTVGATTVNYCWYGLAGGPGQCRTPTTATLNGTIGTGGVTSITFGGSGLAGNIKNLDTLTISDGTTSVTCKAAADAYIGDTTLAVTANSGSGPCATASGTIATGAAIKDTLAFASLDADSHTISNFDTLRKPTSPIQLYPLNQDGTNLRLGVVNNAATTWLNKHGDNGSQRVFYIGVYMPVASGQSQNQLQGLISTFSLNWHIEQ